MIQFSHFLVSITSKYFMLFVAIVKGNISLISFSGHLSSVNSRATEFFELILYPASVLKVFISGRSFLVEFFGWLCKLPYRLQIVKG